uniref:ATP synthase F0 subunit 8 n=3 Tax=Empoascanara TaxID=562279 RepID=A0AA51NHX3_9HEMI|nr:ATP synthase F0 subunit 8 [Empoascanara alami]YP_010952973.1 ATP synthase F0 subunit 8 [Empoascanara hongkongica]QJT42832.1 ATP synthase F0 subunit 8 [Empoascanara dwalata]WMQ52377.1 ATP synthase F0 subunit 8 [Empoascanara alami]WMQ52416.1 ATP synthase F0 subunit 8 [Empoascanara hongkongica]
MPQMSPMWWTFLMIMFILSFIMIMSMLYFDYKKKIDFKINLNLTKMNWKW